MTSAERLHQLLTGRWGRAQSDPMADAPKAPSLKVLEPKLLQLTLDPKHLFAVWRALECYADVCLASAQLGKQAPVSVLQSAGEVQEVVAAHMRTVLGLIEDEASATPERVYYCRWSDGACEVYHDMETGHFVCANCKFNPSGRFVGQEDRDDHVLETPYEMLLHLERHHQWNHEVPMEAIDRLREESRK